MSGSHAVNEYIPMNQRMFVCVIPEVGLVVVDVP